MRLLGGIRSFFMLSAVAAVSLAAPVVHAADAEQTSEMRAKTLITNKRFEESQTLSDTRLKAESGSLSRFSAKGSLSYFGPTLGDLSAAEQPNPDGSVGNFSQAIKGAVSVRYRFSSDTAMSAGTGVAFNKPFHGMDRVDANNPFLSYDFSDRFGDLQMRNSPGLTISTVPNFTAIGQIGGVSWDTSLVYKIADSRLAASLDLAYANWIFTREYRPGSTRKGGDGLAQLYSFSWYPGLKYNATDALNLYTSLGFQLYNPRAESIDTLWNRTVTVRLGAGYAFTRDVYFAPYLSSYVTKLAFDTTSVNVSGIFSVL